METLYRWRVQEKDRQGRVRWRLMRMPMTEETARFWAANNHAVISRVDLPVGAANVVPSSLLANAAAAKAN